MQYVQTELILVESRQIQNKTYRLAGKNNTFFEHLRAFITCQANIAVNLEKNKGKSHEIFACPFRFQSMNDRGVLLRKNDR